MKKILASLLAIAVSAASSAQTEVNKYQPGVTVDGITYCLPRTALRFVVVSEKSVFVPGELNKYAERYLRMDDAKSMPETVCTIKEIRMDAYGVPDSSKFYSIALKSKTVAPFVTLADDGRILAIRDEAQEPELPALPFGKQGDKPVDVRRYFTQEMLSAGNKAKLAELAAQEIFDLRDKYRDLISGEASNTPKDGKQLELMLSSLSAQENALTSLFVGTTTTSTEVSSFSWIPDGACDSQLLCRFSAYDGLVDNDDLSGSPVYITVKPLETLPPVEDDADSKKKKEKMLQGVFYNVPVRAEVKVHDTNRTLLQTEMPVAQLGRVEILSDVLFNKNVTTRVFFNGVTGGITHLYEE